MTAFDFIRENIDILQVVSLYVETKQIGGYWKGPCPFHQEKDASFTVSPARKMFYCFGCQKGGDVISFVSSLESMTQFEALNFLAEKYSVEIPKKYLNSEVGLKSLQVKNDYLIWKEATSWCKKNLIKNFQALKYLEERGIENSSVEKFEIGFFHPSKVEKQKLIKNVAKQGFMQSDMFEYGIFSSGNSFNSSFENRIIFPIKDSLSKNIGFGGRVFLQNDSRPKYYNSKESQLFSKSKVLFGLDLAKKEIKKSGVVFLVEGYLDCIAMHQAGHVNSVATLGTSLSENHVKTLSMLADKIIMVYDSDRAGQNSLLKIAHKTWSENIEFEVVQLNSGEDPASFLRKNKNLDSEITKSKNIFDFYIESLSKDFFNLSPLEKTEKLEDMILTINKIENPVKRFLLNQKLFSLTGIDSKKIVSNKGLVKKLVKPDKKKCQDQDAIKFNLEEQILFTSINLFEKKEISSDFLKTVSQIFSEKFEKVAKTAVEEIEKGVALSFDKFEAWLSESEIEKFKIAAIALDSKISKQNFYLLLKKFFLEFRKKIFLSVKRNATLKENSCDRAALLKSLEKTKIVYQTLSKEGVL